MIVKPILLVVYGLLLLLNLWITYAFIKTLPTITDLWNPATMAYSSLFMMATVVTVLIRQVREAASGHLFLQVVVTGLLLLATWLTHVSPLVSGILGTLHIVTAVICALINIRKLAASSARQTLNGSS
jgi:hypothetical protein